MDQTLGPVVVTGGGRGLGHSIASAFAAQGASVALLDVQEGASEVARALGDEHGVDAIGVDADVTDPADLESAFALVRERLGVPRILVTAAGITQLKDALEVSPDEWRRVMAVNVDGTFFAAQAFARGLLSTGASGSAVFISSMSGSIVNVPQRQSAYNTSKAAVSHLAKSLAVEWADSGIRVNAIAPGYFLSDMTRQFTDENPELARDWTSRIPLGRMGDPADLHGLALFLGSEASAYVTGQVLGIDGGYTAI
ncbi:3-oxoacyl-ACP reductase [Microbacterium faecale]|uniref:3-oxoacyl-ACP reductase n=1 Tax=Microbacterium faecale TaxID=1804630 RepID=A0A916Y2S2_9MICO|nr:SDR family oxidoreductase [Microbacterium faecale]GGD27994.1 3-oxoacyl-ACP reductase [Microbacterium faecale]